MEKNHISYNQHIDFLISPKGISENASSIVPLGQFLSQSNGNWSPAPYVGYTCITPTYPNDILNLSTYKILLDIHGLLCQNLPHEVYVPAPSSALHMTVARLISGEVFKEKIKDGQDYKFITKIQDLFSSMPQYKSIHMEIRGISLFQQGVIAASIACCNTSDFEELMSFRDFIYTDVDLIPMGVERKRGFNGHITLGYIENMLTNIDKAYLTDLLVDINKKHISRPLPFQLTRAELRKFDNFLDFYRQEDWPFYTFK